MLRESRVLQALDRLGLEDKGLLTQSMLLNNQLLSTTEVESSRRDEALLLMLPFVFDAPDRSQKCP